MLINYDCSLLTFSILNIVLSVLYYDADFTGKNNIASVCLRFTDIVTVIESIIFYNLVIVTIMRYHAKVQL